MCDLYMHRMPRPQNLRIRRQKKQQEEQGLKCKSAVETVQPEDQEEATGLVGSIQEAGLLVFTNFSEATWCHALRNASRDDPTDVTKAAYLLLSCTSY